MIAPFSPCITKCIPNATHPAPRERKHTRPARAFRVLVLIPACALCITQLAACARSNSRTSPEAPQQAPPNPPKATTAVSPTLTVTQANASLTDAGHPTDASAASALLPIRVFPELPAYAESELDRPFDADGIFQVRVGPRNKRRTVGSCRALVDLPPNDYYVDPPQELLEAELSWMEVTCRAVSMMQSARPARFSRLDALFSAKDPTLLLPPQLGLADFMYFRKEVDAAAKRCRSWKAFDRTLRTRKRSERGFSFQADIWSGEIQYYARADFDGDGYEDLLVRRNAHADEGSFSAAALFLVSMTDKDACLRVVREFGRS